MVKKSENAFSVIDLDQVHEKAMLWSKAMVEPLA